MLTIRQTETGWVLERDGVALELAGTTEWPRYEDAVTALADSIAMLAVGDGTDQQAESDGLLPETWRSVDGGGICFSGPTGDGRDFTGCEWTWRDPATAFVPLMLQTATEFGHFGAELAGFATSISMGADGTPQAEGRFYDSEVGRQFRDMLLGDRSFTVSVDPGAVTYEDECLNIDEDGWCDSWMTNFLTYQIIGITGTPFAGFENAAITLGAPATVAASAGRDCGCSAPATGAPCSCGRPQPELSTRTVDSRQAPLVIRASAAPVDLFDAPLAPPARFFKYPEFTMPTPLTITDQGRVMAHVAVWNTCHTGHLDRCVTPPRGSDYLDFLAGSVVTSEGDRIRTGVLTWLGDHPSDDMEYHEVIAAYNAVSGSNVLAGWADVVAGEDEFGPWVSGALRPGLTQADVRILRALTLSGDWRVSRRTGRHEFLGSLAVNYGGFPITASASQRGVKTARPHHAPTVITAAGMIPQTARSDRDALLSRIEQLEALAAAPARQRLASVKREVALERLRG